MLLNIETHIIGGFIGYLDLHHLETYSIPNFGFESLILFIYIYLSLSPQSELGGVHAPFSKETGRFTRKYQETYMLQAVTRIHVPWNLRSEFSPISAMWPAPVPSPSPGQRGLHCWNQSVRTGNLRRLQTSQSAYVYIYIIHINISIHYTHTHTYVYIYIKLAMMVDSDH